MSATKKMFRVLGALLLAVIALPFVIGIGSVIWGEGETGKATKNPVANTETPQAKERRRRLEGKLPSAEAVRNVGRDDSGQRWRWRGNQVETLETSTEGKKVLVKVECVGKYPVPKFRLHEVLYPTETGTRITAAVIWNRSDNEPERVDTRVEHGREIGLMYDKLREKMKSEEHMWLLLPGLAGENLVWPLTLRGSNQAIEASERNCAVAYERRKEAERNRARAEDCKKASEHGAWAYIQQRVEQHLKNPRSADFPFGGARALRKSGPCTWRGTSWVEATNSFGGTVRNHFTATATRVQGGWRVSVTFH